MMHMKNRCTIILLALLLLLCAVSCGKGGDGADTTPQSIDTSTQDTTPAPVPNVTLADGGKSDYVIVFAHGGDNCDRALEFRTLFSKATGITLPYETDVTREGAPDGMEIVVGRTNRDAFFDAPLDTLVSDAYILKISGNRLLICAAERQGYLRAFAELFKQTLDVEDINAMQTQKNAAVLLPQDYSVCAEPSYRLEDNKTESGIEYATEGSTGGAYNYLKFAESLVYRFPEPVGDSFNYFTLRYSSDAYLKAELVYKLDDTKYTEVLFLEPGEHMTFNSFSDGAMHKRTGSQIAELHLMPIKAKKAEFILEDVAVSTRPLPDDVVYISSGRYKLGIKLAWGGGISYLEDLEDGDSQLSNLLNDHDTGRLVQQSYYGTQSAPYVPAKYGENMWCYNPVQGGDQYNNRSKLVDYSISEDGKSIYVKCRPLDWSHENSLTPSYMENTYAIQGDMIKVDNRFLDFSGYTHRDAHQELPAFYTVSYLCDFVFYDGTNAFSGDELTVKKDLPFWGGNSNAYFNMKSKETWCAWVGPEGYGIGVYTPIAKVLLAGRHMYNGSRSSKNDATNYVAPLITHKLTTLKPFEYSYYIATGGVNEIRSTFGEVYKEIK